MSSSYEQLRVAVESIRPDDSSVPQRVRDHVADVIADQHVDLLAAHPCSVYEVFRYGLAHPGGIPARGVERALGMSTRTVRRANAVLRDLGLATSWDRNTSGGRVSSWTYQPSGQEKIKPSGQQPIIVNGSAWATSTHDRRAPRVNKPMTSGNVAIGQGAAGRSLTTKAGVSPYDDSLVQEVVSVRTESHELSPVGLTTARAREGAEPTGIDRAADALLTHYRTLLAERGFTLAEGWADRHRSMYRELLTTELAPEEAYRIAWALEECVAVTDRPYLLQTVRTYLVGNDERSGDLSGLPKTRGTAVLAELLDRADEVGRRELMESWLDQTSSTGRRAFGCTRTPAEAPSARTEPIEARNARLRARALAGRNAA